MATTSIVKVNQRFSLLTLAEGGQIPSFDKVDFTVACLMSRAKFIRHRFNIYEEFNSRKIYIDLNLGFMLMQFYVVVQSSF